MIELIVVIAILGILALFLVPQFQGYSQDAKNQVAQANARTLWTAAKAAQTKSEYDENIKDLSTLRAEAETKLGNSFTITNDNITLKSGTLEVIEVNYETNGVACKFDGKAFSGACNPSSK